MLGSSPQPAPWCPEQHRHPGGSNVWEPRAPSASRRSDVPEPRAPSAPRRSNVPEPQAPSAPWCLGCVGASSTIGNFGPCWGEVILSEQGLSRALPTPIACTNIGASPLPVRFPVVLRRSVPARHPRIYKKDEPSPSPIPKLEFKYRYMVGASSTIGTLVLGCAGASATIDNLGARMCERLEHHRHLGARMMDGCVAVNSEGKSGGLAMLWREGVKVEVQNLSKNHIDSLVSLEEDEVIRFTGFYRNADPNARNLSWEMLRRVKRTVKEGWIVGGDFNAILNNAEKDGGRKKLRKDMEDFSDILEELALVDVKTDNGWFTWSNNREGPNLVKERLDRFLIPEDLIEKMPFINTRVVRQSKSDQDAIFLNTVGNKSEGKGSDHRHLFKQIAPPTKNGHAPPPIESRKSSQSVNPYYVWTCAGGMTRPIKVRSASPAVGTSRPVLTVRQTGRPNPKSNYELFNCNNLNIRYWSWNYRGCRHQTCPPMDPR
ncbi:hypothetical protein GOBAR_DD36806 [Gossypium barbadense]|nr:hypothetical protein GOBAR_DD36806 [Gossypium barbadense]